MPLCLGVLAALLCARSARADVPVPLPVQFVLLKKVIQFNRALEGKTLNVVVVFNTESSDEVDAVLKALKNASLPASAQKASSFKGSDSTVAYLMPSSATPAVLSECERGKTLTVAKNEADVAAGKASLSFSQQNGRPVIMIHFPRSKSEGQDFTAGLLDLAKVFR